ncbi:VOC family protein [Roseinatronobacter alkalisoli]|uniref:Aldoketomutase n=1 Tax=Roseinatronobacter alkalisoli TaxID=3028235 RepID=A0ABT5TCS5_9RHOB|nr:VOC family protein [Roseinatronobacter sp. HJB301]MDD7972928.1 VOC family protein [Roseinatronobacter sp. HJB301]
MHYLHTMVRVTDIDASLNFYCTLLGLRETDRIVSEEGRYTNVFLRAEGDMDSGCDGPELELTFNWHPEDYTVGRGFGHLCFAVDDIYDTCQRLSDGGVTINRPPRDGVMAFVRSPDGISIELIQTGERLPPREPWASMPNTGSW